MTCIVDGTAVIVGVAAGGVAVGCAIIAAAAADIINTELAQFPEPG